MALDLGIHPRNMNHFYCQQRSSQKERTSIVIVNQSSEIKKLLFEEIIKNVYGRKKNLNHRSAIQHLILLRDSVDLLRKNALPLGDTIR